MTPAKGASRGSLREGVERAAAGLDRFLFEQAEVDVCVRLRVMYACVLLVYLSTWWFDAGFWFSNHGVLQADTAARLHGGWAGGIAVWFPSSPFGVRCVLAVMLLQTLALGCGIHSRLQACGLWVLLTAFQMRNPLILDGEDTVFRMLAFFMIWMPLDAKWSLSRRWGWQRKLPSVNAWAIRLPQLYVSLIYASAAWSKLLAPSWRDGSAFFYVTQMDDLYGRGALPEWITGSLDGIRAATWGILVLECVLPALLWWPRTRRVAVVLGITMHLAMEYTMHLYLFQWIMVVALCTFWPASRRRVA